MRAETKSPRNRKPRPATSRLVPIKQAAIETGVPYSTLRDRIHQGELPVCVVGRMHYLERRDIDRWIAGAKQTKAQ